MSTCALLCQFQAACLFLWDFTIRQIYPEPSGAGGADKWGAFAFLFTFCEICFLIPIYSRQSSSCI